MTGDLFDQLKELDAKGMVYVYKAPIRQLHDVDHKKNPGQSTRVTFGPVIVEGASISDLYNGKYLMMVLLIKRDADGGE